MKLFRNLVAIAGLALVLAGCADWSLNSIGNSISSTVIDTVVDMSTAGPSDFKTYEAATAAADLATNTIDLAAVNAKLFGLSKAVLITLNDLNEAIHNAWLDLKVAHDSHKSMNFAAFKAAFDAYQAFRVRENIPQAPVPKPSAPPVPTAWLYLKAMHDLRVALA